MSPALLKKTTFCILCLEGAILSFNVAASSALVPAIAKEFLLPPFVAGRIIWLYMLPYGIAALFYGPLVRIFDAKNIELICFFLFSLANLVASISGNIFTLFAARFFMGVFGASVIPLALILIARNVDSYHRGRFIGGFFSATFVASLLGLFLSGIIPWRWIFFIPAILGFILWGHIYFYLPSFKEETGTFKINYLTTLKNKNVVHIFGYIFFVSLIYHAIQQWLGVYFSVKFQFNQFLISSLITLTSLSGIFAELLGGWLADYLGRIRTINLGIIFMCLSTFFLVFKLPLMLLGLIMIIWGLGWSFNHVGLSTMLSDLPQEVLNEAASLNSSVRFISGGLGALLGAALMQKSFSLGFSVFGICFLVLLFSTKLS